MIKIKLFNEDCFEIMKYLISKNFIVDAIITDPPYLIKYDTWDKEFDMEKAIFYCNKLLKENGNIILFQGWSNVIETKCILDKYFCIKNWIIYDRIKGRGSNKNLISTREDILWYCKGDNPTYHKMYSNIPKITKGMGSKNGMKNRALTNVWHDISPIVPWGKEYNKHPTQKPLSLMERIVNIWTDKYDTVLDFTMGSGTTGLACVNLGRNFVGIEKEKQWFDISKERINEAKQNDKS